MLQRVTRERAVMSRSAEREFTARLRVTASDGSFLTTLLAARVEDGYKLSNYVIVLNFRKKSAYKHFAPNALQHTEVD